MISALYTGLSLLLLPGQPALDVELPEATDTCSLRATEQASQIMAVATATTSDTWTLGLVEVSVAGEPAGYTELSNLLWPWAQRDQQADKEAATFLPVAAVDNAAMTWTEDAVDTVYFDSFDTQRLNANESVPILSIIQSYAPVDSLAIHFLEVASIMAGGPVLVDISDTCTLSLTDESQLSDGLFDATDEMALTASSEDSTLNILSDSIETSDYWGIGLALEASTYTVVESFPILGSDQWSLTCAETARVTSHSFSPPKRRRIRVGGTSRHIDVE